MEDGGRAVAALLPPAPGEVPAVVSIPARPDPTLVSLGVAPLGPQCTLSPRPDPRETLPFVDA